MASRVLRHGIPPGATYDQSAAHRPIRVHHPIGFHGIVPDPLVPQRHGHPGNLVVGRGAVTAAKGHDHAADRDAIPVNSPTPTCISPCLVMSV